MRWNAPIDSPPPCLSSTFGERDPALDPENDPESDPRAIQLDRLGSPCFSGMPPEPFQTRSSADPKNDPIPIELVAIPSIPSLIVRITKVMIEPQMLFEVRPLKHCHATQQISNVYKKQWKWHTYRVPARTPTQESSRRLRQIGMFSITVFHLWFVI